MKLVDNARQSFRWFSVQAMVLAGAIQTAWLSLPPDLKARVPADWVDAVTIAVLVLGVIGRLVKQGDE